MSRINLGAAGLEDRRYFCAVQPPPHQYLIGAALIGAANC